MYKGRNIIGPRNSRTPRGRNTIGLLSRMSEHQLHPKDRDLSTHASTVEKLDTFFESACGGCYPRIPMRRPKAYSPGQGGLGRPNPDGPRQDYLLRKTTGSVQRCRDRIRSSLSSRDTVVIQLGLLPCKPTRTSSCNPAPRVYKGSRGTSLEHPRSDLIRQDTKRL